MHRRLRNGRHDDRDQAGGARPRRDAGIASRLPGSHDVFLCGNEPDAKEEDAALLRGFGWPAERIVDVGDPTAARGMEAYLVLWLSLWDLVGSGDFNIRVVH